MKKLNNKKGFTLAELLIVVAIIGVLTAVAIPVFSGQLNKSKAAADESNARSLYGALTADYLDNSKYDGSLPVKSLSAAGELTYTPQDGAAQKFAFNDCIASVTVYGYDQGSNADEPGIKVELIDKCKRDETNTPITFGKQGS